MEKTSRGISITTRSVMEDNKKGKQEMKKMFLMTVVLSLLTVGLAFGQGGPGQPGCDNNGPHGKAGFGQPGNCAPGNFGPRGGKNFGMRGEGRHEVPGVQRILRFADELELTDEQIDKLETMHTEFAMERIDLEAKIEKAQLTLHALMRDDDAREADVLTAIDKVSALKADKQKMHYQHYKAAKEVLTTEQLDKIKELRKDRPGRRGDGIGNGPQNGMGKRLGRNNG